MAILEVQKLDSYQLDRVLSELHRRREQDTEYRQRIIDLERELDEAKEAAKQAVKQPEVVERVKVVYRDRKPEPQPPKIVYRTIEKPQPPKVVYRTVEKPVEKIVYRDRVTKEEHSQCSAKIGQLNHQLIQTQKQLDALNSQKQSLSNRAKMLENERDDAVKRADDAEKTLARRTAEFDALIKRLNQ